MKAHLTYLLLFLSTAAFAQYGPGFQPAFWKLTDNSGEINLIGEFSLISYKTGLDNIREIQRDRYSIGGTLNTTSYFYHPNFLFVNTSFTYNPQTNNYTTTDLSNIKAKQDQYFADLSMQWLRQKKIKFTNSINLGQTINNNDFLGKSKTKFLNLVGNLNFDLKSFPIKTRFNKNNSVYEEINTPDRNYKQSGQVINVFVTKSFSDIDNSELEYSNQLYTFKQVNKEIREIKYNSLSLNSRFSFNFLDTSLRSSILLDNRQTINFDRKKFNVNENFKLNFNKSLRFNGNLNYGNMLINTKRQKGISINGSLSHNLYESLFTSLLYNRSTTNNTDLDFTRREIRLGITYRKKIPFDGKLSINYNYSNLNDDKVIRNPFTSIINENHRLSDGEITLLDQIGVEINSVVVKNENETLTYQINLDYVLFQQGDFVQIERVPGGQISNDDIILVDYDILQQGSFETSGFRSSLNTNISIFNFLNVYYSYSNQEFSKEGILDISYDLTKRNTYGLNLNYKNLNFNLSYDDQESLLFPYELLSLRITGYENINSRLNFMVNGNYRKYFMIVEEDQQQTQYYFGTTVRYKFSNRTFLNFDSSYNNQESTSFIFKTLTGRIKLSTKIRNLYFDMSVAGVKTKSNEIKNEYFVANLKLTRTF